MRSLLAILACVMAGACGTAVTEDSAFGQTLAGLDRAEPDFVPRFITLLEAEAPSLQIGFVETESNGTLLLERQDGEMAYWLSADGAQVILQSGVLHGTRGLGAGLLASELSQPVAMIKGLRSGTAERFHTFLDGSDRAVPRTYACIFEDQGTRRIQMGTRRVATRLMREECRSLTETFVNLYWVAPDSRRILVSRQWAGPAFGALSTRVVPE